MNQHLERGKKYLLWDGDCGVCSRSVEIVEQIDTKKKFSVEPYQKFPEEELKRFGLTYRKCEREIQVITPEGRVYGGAFGVNYFLSHYFPWSLLVRVVHAIPVFTLLEIIGYRIVATNRRHISQWLGLKACSLNKRP